MTGLVFAFLLTLPAFGGVEIEVKAKSIEQCRTAQAAIRKQLMLAGVRYTITDCVQK